MAGGHYSKVPGGNIAPSRFVTLGSDQTVTASAAGEAPWGISGPSTRYPALSAIDDGYAGVAGDPGMLVYGPGCDECPLELGGTVTAGQYIKASTAGVGVAATTDHDRVGAVAVTGGVSGDIIKVKPMRMDVSV